MPTADSGPKPSNIRSRMPNIGECDVSDTFLLSNQSIAISDMTLPFPLPSQPSSHPCTLPAKVLLSHAVFTPLHNAWEKTVVRFSPKKKCTKTDTHRSSASANTSCHSVLTGCFHSCHVHLFFLRCDTG